MKLHFSFKKFWMEIEANLVKAAIWCIGFTLIWVFVSIGLYAIEGSRSYFEIQAILCFKIILTAVIFLSRYFLFAQYRHEKWLLGLLGICFFVALGGQCHELFKIGIRWLYILLKVADAFIWGIYVGLFLENMMALFCFWRHSPKKSGAEFRQLYRILQQDTISLGIILTFLVGLVYYYLTSFYLLDTLLYDYLLLILVIGLGLGFYSFVQFKLNRWVKQDIALLDLEIDHFIQWQKIKPDEEISSKISWFHYLMLVRTYLIQIGRPRFPWPIWCSYLIFSGFILIIPYIFGLAIQVGSFK